MCISARHVATDARAGRRRVCACVRAVAMQIGRGRRRPTRRESRRPVVRDNVAIR